MSRWTIYCRVQSYGLQNKANFSLLPDTALDKLVLEYIGRHGLTTGRTYLAGYLKSLGLRIQRRGIVSKGGFGEYCLEVGNSYFS